VGRIREMAEALWTGQTDTYAHHPLAMDDEIEQIADRTWFYKGFSCMVFAETDDGLILVDPGGYYKTIGPDGSNCGGWYDGTPSHLKPAPEKAQADEIARLAGGAAKLAARAEELAAEGELRLACHLAEWAYRAQPDDPAVQKAARQVFTARAKAETSTMSRGIFVSAAREMGGGELDDSVQMTMGVLGQRSRDT